MKRGISSLSFSGPLPDKIEAAAGAGYDGIEIFREDLVYCDATPAEVARFVTDSGLEVLSLQSLRDFEASPKKNWDWNVKRAERFLDLAVEVGAPLLVVCANTRADTVDDPDRAAAELALLADMAAERGLRVGYEALATSAVVRSYVDAWRIVEKADRPNLGLVIGVVHTLALDGDFTALEAIDPKRIFLIHLADAPAAKMDVRLLARHFRLLPGQGDLPVSDVFATLKAVGYDGPVSMEIFNDQLRAMSAKTIAGDGIRAFRLLEEATNAEAAPHPSVLDIGFIEFATSPKEADKLTRILTAMGFVLTHRHKSKNVSLYRQGEINLVVNQEPSGPAHSYYLMHGLSVFAVGFRIDNLPAMIERTRLHLGGTVSHLANPGELDIPAVRGLGGSMVFFLDGRAGAPAFHEVDFEEVAEPASADGMGLLMVDHYSQAIAPTDFLTDLLFYRALFSFRTDEQVDIIDPHGTVRSRSLSNGNGRIRMSLNSSIGPSTMTQRFLDQSVRAAYQHFAFSCADIFAYAKDLDPDLLLQVPGNYYDDLLLRFDLEPRQIESMRKHNILYDQDGEGHPYFQLFTRDINGLFLEVVQRNGYSGFGAANAPVRIAAQTRDYEETQNLLFELRNA
ncbi:MAG: sugar phosphate isomerase/epimerase and 4-hydroxyphenylpyruvate domain-containing protein [Rhodospirillales bacterium]|nr:MAG: sugar phosphate isomerase/epimerase and 4-hydroxyphenylpyruvate domain-containing protein [Rhodospirillales bacterium]